MFRFFFDDSQCPITFLKYSTGDAFLAKLLHYAEKCIFHCVRPQYSITTTRKSPAAPPRHHILSIARLTRHNPVALPTFPKHLLQIIYNDIRSFPRRKVTALVINALVYYRTYSTVSLISIEHKHSN